MPAASARAAPHRSQQAHAQHGTRTDRTIRARTELSSEAPPGSEAASGEQDGCENGTRTFRALEVKTHRVLVI